MSFIEKILNLPPELLNPWVYWIILLVSLLEPLPLIGSFIPGQSMVLLAGLLVKQGKLDFGDLIAFAAGGAILGDLIGYLVGKKYGDSFLTKYGKHFFLKKERLDKVKILLNKYTGRTLILGRFNSVTRCFSPFLAGSTGIALPKFLLYNLIGGLCWSIAFVSLGYVFGKGFEIASKFIGSFVIMGVILSGIIIFLVKLENKGKRIFHVKHRYVLIMNVLSLYLFSKMLEDVVHGQTVTKWDLWISRYILLHQNGHIDKIMILISTILKPGHLEIASAIIFIYLISNKSFYKALFLFTGMGGGLLLNHLIKLLIHRQRPLINFVEASGFSFPSTHTTAATLFFCLIIFLFKEDIPNRKLRIGFVVGNISLFLAVGFGRIYLNVHWFSDVLAGLSLGVFWPTFLILVFKNFVSVFKDAEVSLKGPNPILAGKQRP